MNLSHLTASRLKVDGSGPTGLTRGNKPAGWDCGRYWRTKVNGTAVMCHVLIMMLHTGSEIPEGMEVDHINRDGHDNRIENLRLVTRQQNVCNTSVRKDSKTGVKGVSYREGRVSPYIAHVQRHGKRFSTAFKTLIEAQEWLRRTIND